MDSLVLIANLNSLKSLVKNLCYPNYLIYAPERISSFQQIDKNIKIMSILQMPPTSGRRSLTDVFMLGQQMEQILPKLNLIRRQEDELTKARLE